MLLKALKPTISLLTKKRPKLKLLLWIYWAIKYYQEIKPDPERLQVLLDLQPPNTHKELKRVNSLFAYYARWIEHFSEKAISLIKASTFPLQKEALQSFELLKSDLSRANLGSIRDDLPFDIETDASDYSIAAILSQKGKPVAYFSRTLSSSEKNYPAVEKEASAIIESVKKWSHFLNGRHFTVTTDQRSVSFMFDAKNHGKIKNAKIQICRLELSQYSFDIHYKPGCDNAATDALSRAYDAFAFSNKISVLHNHLISWDIPDMQDFITSSKVITYYSQVKKLK